MSNQEAADQPSLQESLNALTSKAADEAITAADEHDAQYKQGGALSGEEEAEAVNQPSEPIEEEDSGQPAEEPQQLIFGKYKTDEEAEKGYFEAANSLSQTKQQLDLIQQQNQQLQTLVNQLAGNRQMPSEREKEREDYRAKLDAVGVDSTAIEELINERAGALIQQTFGPVLAEVQANELNMANVPGFTADTPRVIQKWLAEPQNSALRARYDAAMAEAKTPELRAMTNEWAFRQMQEVQKTEVSEALEANKQSRNQIAAETKKDAGTGAKGKTTARENLSKPKEPSKYIERDELDKLRHLQRSGYQQKVAGSLISLPDDLFE